MKNKSLKEKLNNYADSLERKDELLCRAYLAMDEKRTVGAYNKKKSRVKQWTGVASLAAAAVVFVLVIAIVLNNVLSGGGGTSPIEPYALSTLQKQSVAPENFYNLANVVFLGGADEQTDGRYFIYVNENKEIYAARAIYKVVRDGNVDEIEVISDLKNNLSDYKEDKPSKNNNIIRYFDSYKNGEYYSYIAALKNSTTYYITITSPSKYAGEYYENILLRQGEYSQLT